MTIVNLDDIVALSEIVAGTVGRPLAPHESSRLKNAWNTAQPCTLSAIADHFAAAAILDRH